MTLHLRSVRSRFGRCRRAGLTLIEVIVSLAIFIMSLVAIGGLVDMGMDRELESQMMVRATRLAQSKMGDLVSGYLPLTSTSGTFDYDSDWTYTVTSAAAPQGQPNLYLMTVTVSRTFKGKQFQYVLNQIIFDPLYIGSAQAATSTTDSGSATPPASGSTGGTP